jgi:glycine oxidase
MTDTNNYDVLIVGNGVLGLSLGLTLARRGTKVAVIGKPNKPWAASSAAGAMLGTFGEVTTTIVGSDEGRAKHEIAYQATRNWDAWLSALYEDSGDDTDLYTARGTIMLLNSVGMPGIDSGNYNAIRASLEEYKEPFEDIDPHDVAWLDANPTTRSLLGMFIPEEHAVDAPALLVRLEEALERKGVAMIDGFGASLVTDGDTVTGVTLESGETYTAGQVVVAGGAASQPLIESAPQITAGIPPLCAGVGVSVLTKVAPTAPTPTSVIRTPNRAFACGLHAVPRGDQHVYLGATNAVHAHPEEFSSIRDATFLLHCALRQLRTDLDYAQIEKVNVGNRPIAFDGFPLIGQVRDSKLWLLTGTYRDGLTLSPLLAEEMAARLLGEETHHDLSLFDPVRKPVQGHTRQEVVDTAVMHMLATGYEDEWKIPGAWPAVIESSLRAAYGHFANELDDEYTPPAELLAKAQLDPGFAKQIREYYAASRAAI